MTTKVVPSESTLWQQGKTNGDCSLAKASEGLRLKCGRGSLRLLLNGCVDQWNWSVEDRSPEVRVLGKRHETVIFHPEWSNGAAGVRGSKALKEGIYYWEIHVSKRLFGTSMMFGVATSAARLHADAFVNLLGKDEFSWGLSHKGHLWHRNKTRFYTDTFQENEPTTVALLLDRDRGTLTYFKDGRCLGVAFTGLDYVDVPAVYPAISSTAAKTQMSLGVAIRSFSSLQDRCRAAILRCLRSHRDVACLPLPDQTKHYLSREMSQMMPGQGKRYKGNSIFMSPASAAHEKPSFPGML